MKPGLVLLVLVLLLDITYAAEGSSYLNFDLRSNLSTYLYVVFGEFSYMKITILCYFPVFGFRRVSLDSVIFHLVYI